MQLAVLVKKEQSKLSYALSFPWGSPSLIKRNCCKPHSRKMPKRPNRGPHPSFPAQPPSMGLAKPFDSMGLQSKCLNARL
eukprot:1854936-Amphidinium_carterae.1